MVTREQILIVSKKLTEITGICMKLQGICRLALFQYSVGGVVKTIPQADIDALYTQYQNLEAQLKDKVDALP